jgi:hypothetical protein
MKARIKRVMQLRAIRRISRFLVIGSLVLVPLLAALMLYNGSVNSEAPVPLEQVTAPMTTTPPVMESVQETP